MSTDGITLEELLQRQDEIYLVWAEPWPGKDADGKLVDACITSRATVRDCLRMVRYVQTPNGAKGIDFGNKELLQSFIAINHAKPATIEET